MSGSVRMARTSASMAVTSFPAIRGAAIMAQMARWARVLGLREGAAYPDFEHVGVVPAAGSRLAPQWCLGVEDVGDPHRAARRAVGRTAGVPGVGDVLGGSPQVGDLSP